MSPEMETTIKITGIEFLKCQQTDCEWNVGWLDENVCTEKPYEGTRICNLGAMAIIEGNALPPDFCPHSLKVIELACAEFEF